MMSSKCLVGLAIGLVVGLVECASAAQNKEEDSAYRWGRWAVLSPAAGGAEPYVAVNTPGSDFNARPGEASDFDPEIVVLGGEPPPPVEPPQPPQPPVVVPNPPGEPAPPGDPRGAPIVGPPVVVPNPPGAQPPSGDPRAAL
jgi:hypothetical protein